MTSDTGHALPSTLRLGFSTLGCVGVPLEGIQRLVADHGIEALELRSAPDDVAGTQLDAAARAGWRDGLGHLSVTLCTYVRLCSDDAAASTAMLDDEVRLAHDLGATGVRVFMGDAAPAVDEPVLSEGEARGVEVLQATAALAQSLGVEVLIETHDSHRTAASVARFLNLAGAAADHVKVVWDAGHTWASGESFEQSLAAVRPRIAHIQVKDLTLVGRQTPVDLGTGIFPVTELMPHLSVFESPITLSLEWERHWHPQLAPMDDALSAYPRWLRGELTPE